MSEFKGTPGPWKCLREEVNKHYIRISGTKVGERFAVANVLSPLCDDVYEREAKETLANAQLIAAAPELLKELQDLVSRCRIYVNTSDAQAAIAKALGKTK